MFFRTFGAKAMREFRLRVVCYVAFQGNKGKRDDKNCRIDYGIFLDPGFWDVRFKNQPKKRQSDRQGLSRD